MKLELLEGRYLAFADINPVGMSYVIEPITITVDEGTETPEIDWESLVKNESATKEFQGKTVTFQHPELIAGKSATLSFDLHNNTPLPYLGGLVHVVVLDEQGARCIHVHPTSNDQTVFEAQFPSPRFYNYGRNLSSQIRAFSLSCLLLRLLEKVNEKQKSSELIIKGVAKVSSPIVWLEHSQFLVKDTDGMKAAIPHSY